MSSVLEAPASEQDWQVGVGVGAGVAHAAAEDYGGVVQNRATTGVFHLGKPLEKVVQLSH